MEADRQGQKEQQLYISRVQSEDTDTCVNIVDTKGTKLKYTIIHTACKISKDSESLLKKAFVLVENFSLFTDSDQRVK